MFCLEIWLAIKTGIILAFMWLLMQTAIKKADFLAVER